VSKIRTTFDFYENRCRREILKINFQIVYIMVDVRPFSRVCSVAIKSQLWTLEDVNFRIQTLPEIRENPGVDEI